MKLNMKNPGHGSAVQWHQDWAFYPHTNDSILAVGIFLDDVTQENGPMLAVPRTHRGPTYNHHRLEDSVFVGGIQTDDCELDFGNECKPITGPRGSVSFHHVRLVHGSDINRSRKPRKIVFLEILAADAWPLS